MYSTGQMVFQKSSPAVGVQIGVERIKFVPAMKVAWNFFDLQVKFQHIIDDGKGGRG